MHLQEQRIKLSFTYYTTTMMHVYPTMRMFKEMKNTNSLTWLF